MNYLRIIKSGLLIIAIFFAGLSCRREVPMVADNTTNVAGMATVQVFNATLNAARNYVYVDGFPVSGSAFSYKGVFPSTAFAFMVSPGTHAVLIKDTLSTSKQVALNFNQAFTAGQNYTIFTYDTITSIKQTTIANTIIIPTDSTCMLRFANFIYHPSALASVDVYSFRNINGTPVFVSTPVLNSTNSAVPDFTGNTPIFSNVATNQVTPFIPYASRVTDTLYVFATGTTAPLIAKSFVTTLTPTRSYTAAYNGIYRGAFSSRTVTTFVTY